MNRQIDTCVVLFKMLLLRRKQWADYHKDFSFSHHSTEKKKWVFACRRGLVPSWHWRARRFISERPLLFLIFHRRNKPMSERILVICSIFVVYDLNQLCLLRRPSVELPITGSSWACENEIESPSSFVLLDQLLIDSIRLHLQWQIPNTSPRHEKVQCSVEFLRWVNVLSFSRAKWGPLSKYTPNVNVRCTCVSRERKRTKERERERKATGNNFNAQLGLVIFVCFLIVLYHSARSNNEISIVTHFFLLSFFLSFSLHRIKF